MKSILFSSLTLLILLAFSHSSTRTTYTPPKPVPLAMCAAADAPEMEALPEFFKTPTYQLSLSEPLHIRRDISVMDADNPSVTALKKAIKVMKMRKSTDPTSWSYQSNIHGTTATDSLPAWNSCAHGSGFFLSWHRMFLYFFERILRKASGDPHFALPYWDWSVSEGSDLPPTFREPTNLMLNPLYIQERNETMNLGGFLAKSTVKTDLEVAMNKEDFMAEHYPIQKGTIPSFNDALESVHGKIHVTVGGKMRLLSSAAQDPIFWMHHCNIDRIWEKWMNSQTPEFYRIKNSVYTEQYLHYCLIYCTKVCCLYFQVQTFIFLLPSLGTILPF